MKLVSNYGSNNWKHTNLQLVALACGVALAAVAIVGGGEVLRDKGDSGSVSPVRVAQPTDPVVDPTDFGSLGVEAMLQPQFGTAADADYASIGLAYMRESRVPVTSAAIRGLEDARGIGQPGEGVKPAEATFIDPTDFASTYADFRPTPLFPTAADAVFAAENWAAQASEAPLFGTVVDAVYVIEGDIRLP